MIGMRTILEVADNSGARRLSCILPRGGDLGSGRARRCGNAAVKEAAPDSSIKKAKWCAASLCGCAKKRAAAMAAISASIRMPRC